MPRCDRFYPCDYATSITIARMLACRVLVDSRACQAEIARKMSHWRGVGIVMKISGYLICGAVSAAWCAVAAGHPYIVQAVNTEVARRAVQSVGSAPVRNLSLIRAVAVDLTPEQARALSRRKGIKLFADRPLGVSGLLSSVGTTTAPLVNLTYPILTPIASSTGGVTAPLLTAVTPVAAPVTTTTVAPIVQGLSSGSSSQDGTGVAAPTLLYQTNYPMLVGADKLQQRGITGRGVTVAVLDTGLWQDPAQNFGPRLLASVDVTSAARGPVTSDPYGHGTHIASIAIGGAQNVSLNYLGIAPQANVVVVRAFDGIGQGSYAAVIEGLNWVVANRQKYNIRVLNLSLGAPPQSFYWDDPLNQAVMAAWRAGIVVVAAAGN